MWSEDDVTGMLINPVYAVSINPDLAGKHEAIVPKQRWIDANKRLIEEIGAEKWLSRLLAALLGAWGRLVALGASIRAAGREASSDSFQRKVLGELAAIRSSLERIETACHREGLTA